jgi:alpha-L-rhamnosidase
MPAHAPSDLRCEYATNPIGLDEPRPRLSWRLRDDRRGARQSAYHIQAAGTAERLAAGDADLWDSGKVDSDRSIFVDYGPPPPPEADSGAIALQSATGVGAGVRVWWRVRVWDAAGEPSGFSEPAFFEMGLLDRSAWSGAKWIGGSTVGGPRTLVPAPCLRSAFTLDASPRRARLYVSALGLYECEINGRVVGDGVFRPGWTDYRKRVQYDTYDVTDLLSAGDNCIGAMLGDGWYCGHVANRDRQLYGDRPRLLALLRVELADGRVVEVASDENWRWAEGPIVENDLIMGESYDARREMPGWSSAGFDDTGWLPAEVFEDEGAARVASASPPVRRVREVGPTGDPTAIGDRFIFDFGQNLSGRVRLRVKGPAGRTVGIRHAEMLQKDGSLYTENLRTARATDAYTLRGDDAGETWEPRFTFHGFRYVELSGFPGTPTRDAVTAVVLQSDTPPTGTFSCSDEMLNKLQHCIEWGQRSNFLEVPTDCPQRDERLGWTGDAQVFIRTACFNMDVSGFFAKWQQDLADIQGADGAVGPFAPDARPNFSLPPGDAGPAWSDAIVICPWTVYRCYGDTRLLERHYASLRRYVDHLARLSFGHIRCHYLKDPWGGFGDWVAMDALIGNDFTPTPKDLIGTAYAARVNGIVADIARVLGKADEARELDARRDAIVEAFNREFVTAVGRVQGHNQTSYLLALAFDLLPEPLRDNAVAHLRKCFAWRKWHLSTGFVGTPLICPTLTRFGHTDDAYRVLQQRTYPGWLYPILQGATTMWERWNSYTHEHGFGPVDMNSFNHYAYGAVGEWMYATIAGIDLDPDPMVPAFKRSVIRPQPGGGLTWARASLQTPYGELATDWRIDGGRFTLEVAVPPNTSATVVLPPQAAADARVSGDAEPVAGRSYRVGAGRSTFDAVWAAEPAGELAGEANKP